MGGNSEDYGQMEGDDGFMWADDEYNDDELKVVGVKGTFINYNFVLTTAKYYSTSCFVRYSYRFAEKIFLWGVSVF